MKAYLSKRAARAAERIDARWRERADDPGVFARELLESVELLESSNVSGTPYATAKRPVLRRLLLRKSRCHLYFEIDEASQTIQILHVWDGRRERGLTLTWVEICERYPDRWVVLDKIDWVNDTDFEFTGADVLATFDTRKAASPTMKSLIAFRRRVGCFWTGDLAPPLFTSVNILMAK